MPTPYGESPLTTPDEDEFQGGVAPGSPAVDAPLENGGWLLNALGRGFSLLSAGPVADCAILVVELEGRLALERYDARPAPAT